MSDSPYVPAGSYHIRSPEFEGKSASLVVDENTNGQLTVDGKVVSNGQMVPGGQIDGQIIDDINLGEYPNPPIVVYFEPRHFWYLILNSD